MPYSLVRRAGWRIAALLLVLVVLAGASLTAWHLQASHAHQTAPGRVIDWQHLVRVPGPGMALSGVGSKASGDILTPLAHTGSNAQAVAPEGNYPSACEEGWAYTVGVLGKDVWTVKGSTLEAWVEYLWCPRWSGDQVGLNFSYARAYPLSGCRQIGFGDNLLAGWIGAMIGNGGVMAWDGEKAVSYSVCQGYYGWDYSLTVNGSGSYSVGMMAYDVTRNTLTDARSPCCY